MWLAMPPLLSAPVWPAAGLALYCLTLWGAQYWKILWLASFSANVLHKVMLADHDLSASLIGMAAVTATGSVLATLTGVVILRKLLRTRAEQVNEGYIIALLLSTVALASMITAVTGIGSFYLFLSLTMEHLAGSLLNWWMSESLGMFIAIPFIQCAELKRTGFNDCRVGKLQFLPMLVCLLLVVGFIALSGVEKLKSDRQIAAFSTLLQDSLESSLLSLDDVTRSTAAYISSSERVTPAEFSSYASSLLIRPGIEGLAWIPRVMHQSREGFEARARRSFYPGFSLLEHDDNSIPVVAGVREAYYPFWLVFVRGGRQSLIGYDLGSESRELLKLSIDSGQVVFQERRPLHSGETDSNDDWRYFVPVYTPGFNPTLASVEENRREFIGFVSSLIHFNAFIDDIRERMGLLDVIFRITMNYRNDGSHFTVMDTRPAADRKGAADMHSHFDYLGYKRFNIEVWHEDAWKPARSLNTQGFMVTGVFILLLVTAYTYNSLLQNVRISQRVRQRTEALRKTRQELADILDNMTSYIVEVDFKGCITNVNRTLLRAYGGNKDSLLGVRVTDAYWLHDREEERQRLRKDINDAWRGMAVRRDVALTRKDGQLLFVDMNIIPVRDDNGRVEKVIIAAVDITERKVAEDNLKKSSKRLFELNLGLEDLVEARTGELRQLTDQLEDRIKERTAELLQAQQNAEKANKAKSYFLATMSHEIRTPLNGVVGMLEVIYQTGLSQKQKEVMDVIYSSSISLTELINSILEFSKIESGTLDVVKEPLDLTALVEQVCQMFDYQARSSGVELTMFVDPALPSRVKSDSLRLRQILINLISNAIKFSSTKQPGKVAVSLNMTQSAPSAISVRLDVLDNGIGMNEQVVANLFQAFMQADSSTTRRFGGTGLGLAITHHLVGLLEGNIAVTSEPDNGSRFSVSLPFEVAVDDEPAKTGHAQVEGLNCLVIGDEQGIVSGLMRYLDHDRARVKFAETIQVAESMAPRYSSGDWVWIYDQPHQENVLAALRQAASAWTGSKVSFLTIERGARRSARRVAADHVMIDANLLRRAAFMEAVMMAAGLVTLPEHNGVMEKHAGSAEGADRGKARILVVEDNVVNQKVIVQQLDLLGYDADLAGNGVEALSAIHESHYHLIFTDLSMPEMDGYQFVEQLRSEERDGAAIPVVALTANAFKEEMARCFEKGMNDYLTKPVELARLKEMLEKWLPQEKTSDAGNGVEGGDARDHTIDTEVLRELVGNDEALFGELLQDYMQQLNQDLPEITWAFASGEWSRLQALAHTLKSSSRVVGAQRLGELFFEVETACRNKEGISNNTMDELDREVGRVLAHIGKIMT
ncbi:Sensor histidine kinase RcsC [Oceanimonas sp. MB9]|nr:Sensor histidine kinase RcsC [Oceanimonas sp. MB9]